VRCTRWPGSFPLWPELPSGEWQVGWAFDRKPDRADLATWIEQSDPIALYMRKLVASGVVDRARIEASDERVRGEIAAAVRFAMDSSYPAAGEAHRHVWA
jgi:TPP-dependent pyruvate/acetoin dehydrogenase alpha subunit